MWWVCKLFCKPCMSRIVDRDRGRSVLMSGIVWCYLESLVTTRLRPFHRISLSNQGQRMWPGDTGPGANKWFLPRQPLKTPFQQPFVKGENNKSWQLRSKSILDICYGCWRVFIWHLVSWLLGRRFILWQTIPGDTEPESGEWRVSASHLELWAH